jgi:hypothetical protein
VAIVRRVFRYPDGRKVSAPTFRTDEHFGIGQTCEHDGMHWKAVAREDFIAGNPDEFVVFFEPDE